MGSRSFSVGGYTRSIDSQVDPFNERVMAIKNDDASELEDNPENWPAEKVKAAALMFQRNDQKQIAAAETAKTGDTWTKLHPEYVDSDANAELMRHQLRTNGVTRATIQDFEVAYEQLRASNFLKLDNRVLREQEEQAVQQRANAIRDKGGVFSTGISEEDMYNMPLEDLRRLDAIEAQKNGCSSAGKRGLVEHEHSAHPKGIRIPRG